MKVAVVVVSYNRIELLRQCLRSLENQSRGPDVIYVIDNGSTDGSPEMVKTEHTSVKFFQNAKNAGGAGGFATGMNLALQADFDFVWLMDDDAEPTSTALAMLLEAASNLPEAGFYSSRVTDSNGSALEDHAPVDLGGVRRPGDGSVFRTRHATFVGVMVSARYARQTYLPIADFFIWYDDYEYTGRLSAISQGVYVGTSVVVHPRKPRPKQLGPRAYHAIRNLIWVARLERASGRIAGSPHWIVALKVMAVQVARGPGRVGIIKIAVRAVRDGFATNPSLKEVGSPTDLKV